MERGACETDGRAAAKAEEVGGMSEAQRDFLWDVRDHVLYRSGLATRYHRRRERFFDILDRATRAVALIGGSAAFAAAAKQIELAQWAGLIVAVAGALALVFGFGEKARRYSGLAEAYKRLEADVLRVGAYDYTEEQVNEWRARVAEIESGEPPPLRVLVVLCQNDIAVALNQPGKVTNLPLWKRVLGQVMDFEINEKSVDEKAKDEAEKQLNVTATA